MIESKYKFLKTISKQLYNMKSKKIGKEIDGTTPPSIFIGSYNYPKVYAGPLIAPEFEDSMKAIWYDFKCRKYPTWTKCSS